jgi:iron-sulfur cluster assembly accessory protein
MAVRLTSIAKKKLIKLLHSNKSKTVLFSVEGGGCNGLKYQLQPVQELKQKLDEEIPLDKDMKLRICGKSLFYLLGTEIDWADDFMGQSFNFNNPNTASTCGCGSTFAPKINKF